MFQYFTAKCTTLSEKLTIIVRMIKRENSAFCKSRKVLNMRTSVSLQRSAWSGCGQSMRSALTQPRTDRQKFGGSLTCLPPNLPHPASQVDNYANMCWTRGERSDCAQTTSISAHRRLEYQKNPFGKDQLYEWLTTRKCICIRFLECILRH